MRFSFQAQLWEEVLQWFAEQAGLSLVMDHPPQGSCNYIDDNEYSPIEGIDLLNKMLMPKRFTLIRNQQMLIVIDLSEGIPHGYVPVVTLEELKERGRFELVSMRFPLGRRDVAAVTEEITALLGPNGKAVSLPATKQLLVTDTAEIMEFLGGVITAIPEPPAPKAPAKPKDPVKPEKPVLWVHEIKTADPSTVITVLKQFFASDNFVLDEPNRRFTVNTAPSRHLAIKQVLAQIDLDSPPGRARTLEVYPVEIGPPTAETLSRRGRGSRRFSPGPSAEDPAGPLTEMLKKAVPQAQITYDQAGKQLVVWATSEEHTKLAATLDKILGDSLSERTPHVEAYPLDKLDPDSTLTMFQTLLPDATISLDTKSRVLVALAIPTDHDAIGNAIEKMRAAESGEHAPVLKVYPVAMDMTTAITAALAGMVPEAQVTVDAENNRLVAIATQAEHEAIQATIDQLSGAVSDRNNMLAVYPVKSADPAAVLELLENLYPRLKIVLDTQGNRLMVWARAEEQASIKSTLDQLMSASTAEGERHFETYTVRGTSGQSAASLAVFMPKLQELTPGAQMTHDATTGKLLVWATDAEHARIAAALAKMGQGDTPENTPTIQRYSFTKADPTSAMTLLQSLVPDAQLSIDAKTNDLLAVAVPAEHAKIKSILEQLQPAQAGPDEPVLKYHPLKEALPADVMTLLAAQVPRAKITADTNNKRLMVIASPADHEAIAATITQVEEGGSTAPVLQFIPLEEELPASVMGLLVAKAPGATITPDMANKRLMVIASPVDQEIIATLIQQATAAGPTAAKMQFLSLEEKVPAAVLSVIQTLVPAAQVTVDDDGKTLMVVASPSDFEKVKETITQAMESLGPDEENSLAVYPVTPASRARAEALMASISPELPGIQILPDTNTNAISVWAKPSQHKVIADIFAQLKQETVEPRRFKAFSIKGAVGLNPTSQAAAAAAIVEQLQTLVPNAKLTMDAKAGKLLAFGTPSELEVIGMAVAELGPSAASAEGAAKLVLYDLAKAEPTSTMTLLQGLVPGAEITLDAPGQRLLVFATPEDHEAVSSTLDMLQTDDPGPDDPQLFFYLMEEAPPAALVAGLQGLVPGATVTYDAEEKTLMVIAKPADQKVIEQAVEEMGASLPQKEKNTLIVYPATPDQRKRFEATLEVIKTDMPDIQIVADEDGGNVSVWAKPSEHEIIGEVLLQLRSDISGEGRRSFEVYPIQGAVGYESNRAGSLQISTVLLTGLQEIVPSAKLMIDPAGLKLIAWATASEHEMIAEAVGKLDAAAKDKVSRFEAYSVKGVLMRDAYGRRVPNTDFVSNLQYLAPTARMAIDAGSGKLVVWGTPKDHEIIGAAVEKLAGDESDENRPALVVYQMTTANPATLLAALQQLVPDAQLSVDTQSGSIVALADPKDQETIRATLEKLQPTADGPSKRELLIYPFTEPPPASVATALQAMIPNAQVTMDADGKHLTVVATPAEHALIKESIDKLEKAMLDRESMEGKPYFEAYTVKMIGGPMGTTRYSSVSMLISSLAPLVPDAKLSVDYATGKLIAWATAKHHDKLKAALEKLMGDDSAENTPVVEIHAITRAEPTSTMTLLQSMVPDAQLSIQTLSGNLIALAVPADQETIRSTLERLQPTEPDENTPQIVLYPFTERPPSSVVTGLLALAPKAQITPDPDGKHLMVVATPADHARIKAAIDKLEQADSMKDKPYYEAYTLTGIGGPPGYTRYMIVSALVPTLSPMVPDARLTVDTQTGKLIVWATAKDHEKLKAAIDKLVGDGSPETTRVVEVHAITRADPTSTMTLLQSMVPEAQLSIETTTGNLIALAVPADQETIRSTLERLQPTEPDENTPQIVLYPFTERLPSSVVTGLLALAPKAQITPDPDGKHLMVVATPADHARLKAAIDKLEQADSMKDKPYYEAYTLTDIGGPPGYTRYMIVSALVPTLSPMVPDARLTVDTQTGKLIVWATAKDHEKLKAAIDKLVGDGSPETTRVVEVHAITRADPTSTMTLLQSMVPEAQLSIETTTGNLIALAVPADQETIRSTLERLQPTEPGENTPEIRFYQLSKPAPPTLIPGLLGLVPKAQFTLDPKGERLMVVATAADHAVVSTNLEKIDAAASMEEQNTLKVYPVTTAQRKRFNTLLPTIMVDLPGVQVITDAEPGELSIWARPSQHLAIGKILGELQREVPPDQKYKLVGYPVKSSDVTSVTTVLTGLFPDTTFTADPRGRRIYAHTTPAQHIEIAAAMKEMEGDVTEAGKEKFVAHPVPAAISATVVGVLRELLPGVTMYPDTAAGTIIAWGRDSDHEIIANTIEQLQVEPDSKFKPYLMVYPPGSSDVMALYSLLTRLVPPSRATIVPDPTNRTLAVFAIAKDHETIVSAINSASVTAAATGERTVQTYSLENQTAASATVLLSGIVPQAQYSTGVDTHQLVVSAFAQDHQKIKKALDQLEAAGPPETIPILKKYRLKSATAATASIGMRPVVPQAILSTGSDPYELIAWARPSDHEKIQRIADELSKDPPADTMATFKVYSLEEIPFSTAASILSLSVPQAQLNPGVDTRQLIAWAHPDDHERVAATLKQIDVRRAEGITFKPKAYDINTGSPGRNAHVEAYLRAAVPNATFTAGTVPTTLVAWARPIDHEKIAELLVALIPPGSEATLATYSLKSINAPQATTLLSRMAPGIPVETGANPHQLLVWATPQDHEKLKTVLAEIDREGAVEDEPTTETYSLKHITVATATRLFASTMPQVQFDTGADPKQLIATARPIDHEALKVALDKLDIESPYNQTATLKIYTLQPAYASAAYYQMLMIQKMVPTATISQGQEYTQLVVLASAEDHQRIEELVEELADDLPPEKAPKAVVYTLDAVTPATATQFLRSAVPGAQTAPGDDPSQLVIWATPREHDKITELLQQIDVEGAEDKAAKVVVYTLASDNYTRNYGTLTFLQRAVTGATFTMGSDYSQIIARARPKDHEQIVDILAEFDKEPPTEMAPVTEVYTLDEIDSATATRLLGFVVPDAEFTPGQDTGQLIAFARPLDHVKIKETLLKVDVENTEATTMVIYQLASSNSRRNYFTYIQFLQQEVRGATYTLGATDPSQLIVSARPRDHEKIAKIIQELEKEAPPELKPTLVTYSLQYVTADDAMRLLNDIVPEAELNGTANDHQFIALATPKEHEKLAGFLADLDKEETAETKPTTAVYDLEKITATTAEQVLSVSLPDVNFEQGSDAKQLIAVARPVDHLLIKSTLALIDVESPFEKESTVVIYTLETASRFGSYDQRRFLESEVPEAVFSSGSETGQLVVRARPQDHAKIEELIVQLSKDLPLEKQPKAVVYTLEEISASDAMDVLREAADDAEFSTTDDESQLVVWATPKDHEKIATVIEQIDVETTDTTTQIYQLASSDSRRNYYTYIQFLRAEVPGARYSLGATDPSQLIISARAKDHTKILELIQQLEKEAPPELKPTLVTYSLQYVTAADAMRLLSDLVPEADLNPAANDRQFVALASTKVHEKLAGFLADLDKEETAETKPTTLVYDLDKIAATTAEQVLSVSLPDVNFEQGSDAKQLIAVARPVDHLLIKSTLALIDVESTFDKESTVVIYTLETASRYGSYDQRRFLESEVPEAVFSSGSERGQLVVRARPRDHTKIEELIAQLSKDLPLERQPKAVVYTLEEISASDAMDVLREAADDAEFSTTDDESQLIVWATPKDHEKIATVIEQIDVETTDTTTTIYQLASSNSRRNYYTYIMFLREEVPNARYSLGATDPSQLIVSARAKDHTKILELIQQLEKEAPPALKPTLVTYSLQYVTADDAMRLLNDIVPEAELNGTANDHQFIALATPKEHEKLAGFLADLDKEETAETKPTTVVYDLEKITATTAEQVLSVSLPEVNFEQGSDAKQLIAVARPVDHLLIKSTLALIDVESPFEKESTVVIYTLETTSRFGSYYQRQFLQDAVPEASITSGSESNQLVIRARPDDHKKIEELIEQLSKDLPLEKQPKAVFYALEEISPDDATTIIREAARDAEVSTTDEGQLMIWATPKDHEKIATVLKQIDVAVPPEMLLQVVTYPLKETTAVVAIQLLEQAIPQAECSSGADPKLLIVRARPKDHELVKSLLDTIDVVGPSETEGELVMYELHDVNYLDRVYLMLMLRGAVPEATCSVSRDEEKMLVWGRQKDHDKIKQIIDQLAESPEKVRQAVVYSLKEINATTARLILIRAYPDLDAIQGADPQLLIVWARENEHAKVKATLAQIDVEAPEGSAATVKVYDMHEFSERSIRYILILLRDAVSNIRYVQGADPTQVVIFATPKAHEDIADILEQLADTPETAEQARVYNVKGMRAVSVMALLRSAVPNASCTSGADAYQFIAWARPVDHEKIQATVDRLSEEEPQTTAASMVVYSLENLDAAGAMRLLRTVVPEAQFGSGANARQLIAWARPDDHKKIQETIGQMAKEEPEETAPRFKVYTVEATGATDAIVVLQAAVPEAEFNVGADSRQLIAFARPAEHEKITAALDQLATQGPEESRPTIKVYSLETAGATNAMRVLQTALPEAQFSLGDDSSKLIAWAYPEDHAVIDAAVKEIEADSWLDGNREMSVYSVRREDVDTLMQLLDPVLRQHAQFVTDDERESLIVWASKKYHEAIRQTIDEFIEKLPEPIEPEVVVYRFERSDPRSAFLALRTLVPEAQVAYDTVSDNLVVTALPEYQKKVRATIDEIDREGAGGQAPELKIYHIRTADPRNVMTAITTLFRTERNVQLSMDGDNDSLIAYAAPRHHQRIAELIAEAEKGTLLNKDVTMELHSLKNVDTYSSLSILEDALAKMGGAKADLSTDYTRNALVAIALPEHQAKIREILEELRGEERILEIFQLDYLELATAERAIRQLFSEESIYNTPQTEADYETQQLFIRATAEQLAEVRHLLIQLGEIGLTSISSGSDSRLRVIPFKGDLQSIVEEIKRVWPQLRSNEMKVFAPDDLVPESKAIPQTKPAAEPKPAPKPVVVEKPKPATTTTPAPAATPKPAVPAEKPKAEAKPQVKPAAEPKAVPKPVVVEKPKPATTTTPAPAATPKPAVPAEKPKAEAKPQAKPAAEPKAAPKPVVVEKPKPATTPKPAPAATTTPTPATTTTPTPATTPKPATPAEQPKAEAKPEAKPAAEPKAEPKPAPVPEKPETTPPPVAKPAESPKEQPKPAPKPAQPEPAKGAAGPEGQPGTSGMAGPRATVDKAKSTPGAPVTLMVGKGSLTIASDDIEALNELESLLRTLSERSGSAFSGRNYSVFELHNTSASAVSQTLQTMFRDKISTSTNSRTSRSASSRSTSSRYDSRYGYGGRPTPLIIVPDERLNTLFVQGSRSDRNLIESLLQMLDTDEVPETSAARKPKMIPIQNARASEVEQTIRSVYSSQLASSSSRTGGAAFAPMVAVDEITNTLIVTAPAPLMDDITQLAESLDEKAGDNPAQRLKIIRLKKANSTRVEGVLNQLLRGGSYRGSSRGR